MEEIVNRVANSGLLVLDLEDFFPIKTVVFPVESLIDGPVLREKEFRAALAAWDITPFQNAVVSVTTDEQWIVPLWLPALVSAHLAKVALFVLWGSSENLIEAYYADVVSRLSITPYRGQTVLLKGCSTKPVPEGAYAAMAFRLAPHVKSLMYGEACSTVPLCKNK